MRGAETAVYECISSGDFGRLVKLLRHRRNLKQTELAERSGVSVNTIIGLERGRFNVSEDIMRKLSSALGMDLMFTMQPKR